RSTWGALAFASAAHAAGGPIRSFTPVMNARDFCLAAAPNGTMHVYYINNNPAVGDLDISHASSTDLIHWSAPDVAIAPRSMTTSFDSTHVWAATVVQNPNDQLYYMFYTGVKNHGPAGQGWDIQAIGLARAPDLAGSWQFLSATMNPCDPIVPCPGGPF